MSGGTKPGDRYRSGTGGQYRGGALQGFCPMGCGQTLERVAGGTVKCVAENCPRPDVVHLLLQDAESEHIVTVEVEATQDGPRTTFTLRHPLKERVDGQLERCRTHLYLQRMGETGELANRTGRWRLTPDPKQLPGRTQYSWETTAGETNGSVAGDDG